MCTFKGQATQMVMQNLTVCLLQYELDGVHFE